jgi:hypothetical protein
MYMLCWMFAVCRVGECVIPILLGALGRDIRFHFSSDWGHGTRPPLYLHHCRFIRRGFTWIFRSGYRYNWQLAAKLRRRSLAFGFGPGESH